MDAQILWFMGGILIVALGVIVLGTWLQSKQKSRERELEHVERMKAIECGYPLSDENSARHKMLGAVGVIVPAASLAAAAWATYLILGREDFVAPRWLLAVVWGVSGLVALTVGQAAVAGLRPRKVVWPGKIGEPNRAAAGVSARLSSEMR